MAEESRNEQSLDELEGEAWGPAPEGSTTLVAKVHALRQEPVGELTADDLRLLIGQKISLPILLPRAIQLLKKEPLLEATFYPGDLLAALLRIGHEDWQINRELIGDVLGIVARLPELPDELRQPVTDFQQTAGRIGQ